MPRIGKRSIEALLRRLLGDPRRMAGRGLILAYHNVVPDLLAGQGDRSLHLPFTRFVRQLELLQQYTEVVPLPDLLSGLLPGPRPRIAVTFDDAYLGAVELAVPELERRGLPSTWFVAPGLLGARGLWWDVLANGGQGLTEAFRTIALQEYAGLPQQIPGASSALAEASTLPECYACADESALRLLASGARVTIGAHSWNHPNLARVPEAQLRTELAAPLTWLRERFASASPLLAYPYGLSSAMVEAAAGAAGYVYGFRVDGGHFTPGSVSPMTIPRYNVPAGLSDDGFLLRLAGRFTN